MCPALTGDALIGLRGGEASHRTSLSRGSSSGVCYSEGDRDKTTPREGGELRGSLDLQVKLLSLLGG